MRANRALVLRTARAEVIARIRCEVLAEFLQAPDNIRAVFADLKGMLRAQDLVAN